MMMAWSCIRSRCILVGCVLIGGHQAICAQNSAECDSLEAHYRTTLKTEGDAAALPICQALQDCILKTESDTSLRYAIALRWEGNRLLEMGRNAEAEQIFFASIKALSACDSRGCFEASLDAHNNICILRSITGYGPASTDLLSGFSSFIEHRYGRDSYELAMTRKLLGHHWAWMGLYERADSTFLFVDSVLCDGRKDFKCDCADFKHLQGQVARWQNDDAAAFEILIEQLRGEFFGCEDPFLEPKFLADICGILQDYREWDYALEFALRNVRVCMGLYGPGRNETEAAMSFLTTVESHVSQTLNLTDSLHTVMLEKLIAEQNREDLIVRRLINQGAVLISSRLYRKAIIALNEAVEIKLRGNLVDNQLYNALLNLSIAQGELGLNVESEENLSSATALRETGDIDVDPIRVGRELIVWAQLWQRKGDSELAHATYNAAKRQFESVVGGEADLLDCMLQQALLYSHMEQPTQSEKALIAALELIRSSREVFAEKEWEIRLNLSIAHSTMGLYYQAIEELNHLLLDISDYKGYELLESHVFNALGVAHSDNGDFEKASKYYMASHDIRDSILDDCHEDVIRIKNNIAVNCCDLDSPHHGLELYRQILNCELGQEYNALVNYAGFLFEAGELDSAAYYFSLVLNEREFEISDYNASRSWMNFAHLEAERGNSREALSYAEKAVVLKRGWVRDQFTGLSASQRKAIWSRNQDDIDWLLHMAVADGVKGGNSSYDAMLFGKSLLLYASLEIDKEIIGHAGLSVSKLKEELISKRVFQRNLLMNCDSCSFQKEEFEGEIRLLEKSIAVALEVDAISSSFNFTWKDVRKGLVKDEVAIEFGQFYESNGGGRRFVALLVDKKRKGPRLIPLCASVELYLAWDTLSLSKGENVLVSYSKIDSDLERLHDLLWAPLESTLDSGQTVYFSGSGVLNQLPFHAMYREDGDGRRSYVMDRFDLRPLSTTRLIPESRHNRTNPVVGPLLSLGGVDFSDMPDVRVDEVMMAGADLAFERTRSQMEEVRGVSDFVPFGPLVGTAREVQDISAAWRDAGMVTASLSGSAASEHALKARLGEEVPAVLHIATHGFAFPNPFSEEDLGPFDQPEFRTYFRVGEDPLGRVGLILAGGNQSWVGRSDTMLTATGEDGILTAAEIADMDLRGMDLVVLSACETGLGELDGMEGTMGLFRAFKLAGVENVVQSFWSVPDKETQELMAEFYSRLTAGQDPQSAFSGAQKAMRNRYPNDPARWAAFTLMR